MKKRKFNVEGTVLANIFVNGIEANRPEEAIKIFEEKFENLGIVGWTDWRKDIEVSEVIDYSEKVNDVLKRMGLDGTYKVSGVPEIVFEYDEFTIFSARFECLLNVYFIVFKGTNEVFLPVLQRDNSFISFSYMCGDKPFKDNLNKVFFSNGKDVLLYVPELDEFELLEQNGTKTVFGNRINYIIEKSNVNELNIVSSDVLSIVLTSNNKKIILNAEYESEVDTIPYRLNKIESII